MRPLKLPLARNRELRSGARVVLLADHQSDKACKGTLGTVIGFSVAGSTPVVDLDSGVRWTSERSYNLLARPGDQDTLWAWRGRAWFIPARKLEVIG